MLSFIHSASIVHLYGCVSRTNNRKIDRLQESCLRIIYHNKLSSFKKLVEKDSSVSFLERNVQILAAKMYKVNNNFHLLI